MDPAWPPHQVGLNGGQQGEHQSHKGYAGGLLCHVRSKVTPQWMHRLQQQRRKLALQYVFFEDMDQPHHRELAHHKCCDEVTAELVVAKA